MRAEEPGIGQNYALSREDRDSIWSVTRGRRALYFGLFTIYAFAGIGFLLWYEIFERKGDTWTETIFSITQGIGVTIVGAAGLALLTIEGPKTVMVVADYITERWLNPLKERRRREAEQRQQQAHEEGLAEGHAEGLAEGLAEGHAVGRVEGRVEGQARIQAAWEAWNERRLAAEARGESFGEPPPELPAEQTQDDGDPPPRTSSTEGE